METKNEKAISAVANAIVKRIEKMDESSLRSCRAINEIIIHCTATKEGCDFSAADVRRWHLQRKFADIGYHFVVRLDGTVESGRPVDRIGAHCLGHNARSIGVCYVGGLASDGRPKDTRTTAQRVALRTLAGKLKRLHPSARVHGHRDFANKACPCFNARAEFERL